jgi:hypothetical protein
MATDETMSNAADPDILLGFNATLDQNFLFSHTSESILMPY